MHAFDDDHHLFTKSYQGSITAFGYFCLVFIINLNFLTQGQYYSYMINLIIFLIRHYIIDTNIMHAVGDKFTQNSLYKCCMAKA